MKSEPWFRFEMTGCRATRPKATHGSDFKYRPWSAFAHSVRLASPGTMVPVKHGGKSVEFDACQPAITVPQPVTMTLIDP